MRANSLATRLFLSATAWVFLILIVTGFALSSLYSHSVERAFDRRLNFYLRTLIAEVTTPEDAAEKSADKSIDKTPEKSIPALGEPLFELPLSGWYWEIENVDSTKQDSRSSRSLWDANLPKLDESIPLTTSGVRVGYVIGPEDQRLRMVERPVDLGADGKYIVTIAGDASEILDETRLFDWYLGGTFAALAAGLLLSTLFQVKFGLAPLKRISSALSDIRSGKAEQLQGRFPVEIEPLARETNALIEANRAVVERSRTHVGNLAHAIKTPLSVIVNEAGAHGLDPFAMKVLEQADIMRNQVSHHLERARIAARITTVSTVTDVAPVLEALTRTMEKIHRDKNIEIKLTVPPTAKFRGERQDLEEMAGNLVDNACKWAEQKVFVDVSVEPAPARGLEPTVKIVVDDDGRGLSVADRAQVVRRGQRLDESKPGSGLGLAIVVDLARLYGGNLKLDQAPIGGLRAELSLPAVVA
jgi:signal transduction histidine kinase